MKDLRKKYKGLEPVTDLATGKTEYPIRFYMCGEYGENYGRPHYHACLFNFDFRDKEPVGKRQDFHLYRSDSLDALWRYGFTGIGSVTFQSAAYIARYVMKKRTGKGIDPSTGKPYTDVYVDELTGVSRTPEFNKMSLKPGIGYRWYSKFKEDVYPHDYVVMRGSKVRPPKYYDRLLSKDHPEWFDDIKLEREIDAIALELDNTPDRLAVKAEVLEAKLSHLKRSI
jgi:hypothetical protein